MRERETDIIRTLLLRLINNAQMLIGNLISSNKTFNERKGESEKEQCNVWKNAIFTCRSTFSTFTLPLLLRTLCLLTAYTRITHSNNQLSLRFSQFSQQFSRQLFRFKIRQVKVLGTVDLWNVSDGHLIPKVLMVNYNFEPKPRLVTGFLPSGNGNLWNSPL